jgi:hypothetical protein
MSPTNNFIVNGGACTQEEFVRIACEPTRSVVVEACAGSGKTFLLVSRMLRLLLDGCEPSELLAITFFSFRSSVSFLLVFDHSFLLFEQYFSTLPFPSFICRSL